MTDNTRAELDEFMHSLGFCYQNSEGGYYIHHHVRNEKNPSSLNNVLIPYVAEQILDWYNKQIKDPFDYVQPCEPDCSPERHAYHQGQWDMAHRMADKEIDRYE